MGDVMQNGGYTIMQTIVVIDLSESVVPGIVWRHRILMSPNNIRKVFATIIRNAITTSLCIRRSNQRDVQSRACLV